MLDVLSLIFWSLKKRWQWPAAAAVAALFLAIDLTFFGANLMKIGEGGGFRWS